MTHTAPGFGSFHPFGEAGPADVNVFQSLLDHSGLCLASLDTRLGVLEMNQDFVGRFGYPVRNLRGVGFLDLLHPAVRLKMRLQFERLLEGKRKRFVEHLCAVGAGQPSFGGDVTGIAVLDPTGALDQIIVVVNVAEGDGDRLGVDRRRMLSELDARILEGIASGESAIRLASRHFLSRQGVEYHVRGMLKKLGAPNRAALVSKAYSVGVLSVASWPPKVSPDYVK